MRWTRTGLVGLTLLGLGCAPHYVPSAGLGLWASSGEGLPNSCARLLLKPGAPSGLKGVSAEDEQKLRSVHKVYEVEPYLCYSDALKAGNVQGDVTVVFVVSEKGDVCAIQLKQSSVQHPAMEQCILRAVASWHYPRVPDARPVSMTYRFVFKPQSPVPP